MARIVESSGLKVAKAKPTSTNNVRMSRAEYEKHVLPFSESAENFVGEIAHEIPLWTCPVTSKSAAERAGLFMRAMRGAAGLSQATIEQAAQIRQSEISAFEHGTGKMGPTFDVLTRFADACGFYLTFAPKTEGIVHVVESKGSKRQPVKRLKYKVGVSKLGTLKGRGSRAGADARRATQVASSRDSKS